MGVKGGIRKVPLWEIRLARRAIKNRWPINAKLRKKVIRQLEGVLDDGKSDARSLVHASKALLDADRLNMEQEKRDGGIADKLDITSGGQPLLKILQASNEFDPDSA